MVKSRELILKMEIKIEVPEDILSDKDRLKAVEQGIVKAVSKGLYEEGLRLHSCKGQLRLDYPRKSGIIILLI